MVVIYGLHRSELYEINCWPQVTTENMIWSYYGLIYIGNNVDDVNDDWMTHANVHHRVAGTVWWDDDGLVHKLFIK